MDTAAAFAATLLALLTLLLPWLVLLVLLLPWLVLLALLSLVLASLCVVPNSLCVVPILGMSFVSFFAVPGPCVCVCVWERERERDSSTLVCADVWIYFCSGVSFSAVPGPCEFVCVCVRGREMLALLFLPTCLFLWFLAVPGQCMCERESVCVFVFATRILRHTRCNTHTTTHILQQTIRESCVHYTQYIHTIHDTHTHRIYECATHNICTQNIKHTRQKYMWT